MKMLRRIALAVAWLPACGGSPIAPVPPLPEPVGLAEPAPITAAELEAYVTTLAADEFLGRGTLEEGEMKAAVYIETKFRKFGLKPLPGRAGYRLPVTLTRRRFDVSGTSLSFEGRTRSWVNVPGVEFKPFDFSDEGALSAPIVFAGYGITAPEIGYDDYEGLDVAGKVVFVLRSGPVGKGDKGGDVNSRHMLFADKARNAQNHGARGMVLVTDPRGQKNSDDFRLLGALKLPPIRSAELVTAVATPGERAGGAQATVLHKDATRGKPFLSVWVGPKVAQKLIGEGRPLSQIQTRLDARTLKANAVTLDFTVEISVKNKPGTETVHATNVAGFLPGADPRLADEWVVVGAHYDHLGALTGTGDTVYNGADDNASGTSAVLSLARWFSQGRRPRRSMVFVGFSGEEAGLLGSKGIVQQKLLPLRKIRYMLNLDMIGRNSDTPVLVTGDGFARDLKEIIEAAHRGSDLAIELGGAVISGRSDHYPFFEQYIPFTNFFTGIHEDYHQLGDHVDKLDIPRMEKIVRLAGGILRQIVDREVALVFIHRPKWLGVAMEVASQPHGNSRVVVTEVDAGSPAHMAGIQVGDVLSGLDGATDTTVMALLRAVYRVKPGAVAKLSFDRNGGLVDIIVPRTQSLATDRTKPKAHP